MYALFGDCKRTLEQLIQGGAQRAGVSRQADRVLELPQDL
jgi:hypothetical protein